MNLRMAIASAREKKQPTHQLAAIERAGFLCHGL
jgi:hypothetical protein